MNLSMRRLVRTPYSEQYALFDLDRTNESYDPLSMGKLDLHYTNAGTYGTFILWESAIGGVPAEQLRALVEATVRELCAAAGVADYYAVEFSVSDHQSYALLCSEHESAPDECEA